MKVKEIFEDKILREEYKISHDRKKIGGEFRKKFFIRKPDGSTIGRKLGYDNKEEAVKDLLIQKDKNFLSKSPVKQKEKIDRYIKQHKM